MKGNFHVRFLEGDGLATARPYSVRVVEKPVNKGETLCYSEVAPATVLSLYDRREEFNIRVFCGFHITAVRAGHGLGELAPISRPKLFRCFRKCKAAHEYHSNKCIVARRGSVVAFLSLRLG